MSTPIFEPVTAPILKSVAIKEVARFKRERELYLAAVNERRALHRQDRAIFPKRLAACIEPVLLQSICMLELDDTTPEEVTDEELEEYLDGLLANETITIEDLEAIIEKEVRYDLKIADANGRLMKLFADVERVSQDHGLEAVFATDDGKKRKTKLILKRLKPAALQKLAESEVKLRHPEAKTDLRALYRLLLDLIVQFERFNPVANSSKEKDKAAEKPNSSTQKGKGDESKAKTRKPPRDGCLNCKVTHWLRDCPTKPDQAKCEQMVSEAKKKREERAQAKAVVSITSDSNDKKAVFAGVVEWPATLDSGANRTYIPGNVADAIIAAGKAKLVPSAFKVQYVAGVGGGRGFITVPVVLETAKGRVKMDWVQCWIIDGMEMDTALIGAPELEKLGINPDAALDRMIEQESEQVNYAAAVELVDGDSEDVADLAVGTVNRSEILEEIDKMVSRAEDNGATLSGLATLREILSQNLDVFRTRLGPDPPAKVTPMTDTR